MSPVEIHALFGISKMAIRNIPCSTLKAANLTTLLGNLGERIVRLREDPIRSGDERRLHKCSVALHTDINYRRRHLCAIISIMREEFPDFRGLHSWVYLQIFISIVLLEDV